VIDVRPRSFPQGAPPEEFDLNRRQDVVSSLTEPGLVQCDIYAFPSPIYGPGTGVIEIETDLLWPEDWSLVGWRTAKQGSGELTAADVGAGLSISWVVPPLMIEELVPIARFIFDAPGAGLFEALTGSVSLLFDSQEVDTYVFGDAARIAYPCATCVTIGQSNGLCGPRFGQYESSLALSRESTGHHSEGCLALHSIGV